MGGHKSYNKPEYRKKIIEAAKASHKSNRMKKYQGHDMGILSRKFENEVASKLKYKEIYHPQEVCDRIAIVNGNPLFIEIKHKGENLRPKQKRFKEIMGKDYIVIRD